MCPRGVEWSPRSVGDSSHPTHKACTEHSHTCVTPLHNIANVTHSGFLVPVLLPAPCLSLVPPQRQDTIILFHRDKVSHSRAQVSPELPILLPASAFQVLGLLA